MSGRHTSWGTSTEPMVCRDTTARQTVGTCSAMYSYAWLLQSHSNDCMPAVGWPGAPSCASSRQPASSAASSCGRRRRHSTSPAHPCAALARGTHPRLMDRRAFPEPLGLSKASSLALFLSLQVCRRAMQRTPRALASRGRTRDRLRCDDARADGRLDGDAELLPRDELLQLLHQVAAHAVGCIPVHNACQRLRDLRWPWARRLATSVGRKQAALRTRTLLQKCNACRASCGA